MKPNLPRTWYSLPQRERDTIIKAITEQYFNQLTRDETELQKTWLKLSCITLHKQKDPFGKLRCMVYLRGFKKTYNILRSFKTVQERDKWMETEIEKIFGKGGYPSEWVDKLEDL